MVKVLHFSDTHIGSGFSHGKINPKTKLNTRLEDFNHCLTLCIDRAIALSVDLVLFGGDAFPDATPPPYIHQLFATQFRRLADAEIPTVLLVGNHDQHSQGGGAASLSIYRTLGVPGFIVGETLSTHRLSTKNGPVQVITLPWINNTTLLSRAETEGLSLTEVDQLLLAKLQPVLEHEIRHLDPTIPTILLGHLMADRASLGAEMLLAVGRGFTVPVGLLMRPELDYVALGHVHKHQNLNPDNNPPIIYPGSIERVDFSEEKETKGYILAEVTRGQTHWEFCPLPARPFLTIEVDVSGAEDPQATILKAIDKANLQDAVVRLHYKIRAEQIPLVNNGGLQKALQSAHTYTIRPELKSEFSRPRIPEFNVGNSLDPLKALSTYLKTREDLQDLVPDLLEAAEQLLRPESLNFEEEESQDSQSQLRLL